MMETPEAIYDQYLSLLSSRTNNHQPSKDSDKKNQHKYIWLSAYLTLRNLYNIGKEHEISGQIKTL